MWRFYSGRLNVMCSVIKEIVCRFNPKEKKKRDDERAAVNMRRAGGG